MNMECRTIRVLDVAVGDVIRPFGVDVSVIGTGGLGPGKWALQFTYGDGRRDSHSFDDTATVPLVKATPQPMRSLPEQLTRSPSQPVLGQFECQYLDGSTGHRVSVFHVEAGTLPMARAIARVGWSGVGMDRHTLHVVSIERCSSLRQEAGSEMQAKALIMCSRAHLEANSRSVTALLDGAEQFNLNDRSFIECDRWGNRKGFAPNGWYIASGTVRTV